MVPVTTALLALLVYVATADAGTGAVAGVIVVIVVSALLLVGSGAVLGTDQPAVSSYLLWAWTPAVLIVVGSIAAAGIHFGVAWAAGEEATGSEKAIAAALGVVVTAATTQISGWLEKHLAPWMSSKVLCARYGHLFPCTPEGLGVGRQAQESLSDACRQRAKEDWTVAKTADLLRKIARAVAAGEAHGGPNWKCLDES